jgi:hypothetical protein
MALDFPNTPTDGQIYDNYYWDAENGVWNSLGNYDIPNILSNGTFTASSGTTVPLTVTGASGQSANLQEWKSQAGATLASVSANGGLSLNTPLSVQNGGTGASNLTLNGYLKGSGTSAVTSQSGIPAEDLTSGTVSYARFPSGTVVQVVQTVDAQVRTISNSTNESFNQYTALNTTVTPRVSGSRFLIRFQANIGGGPTGGGSFRSVLYVNGNAVGTTGTGNQRASSNSIYLNAGLPGDASIHGLTGEFLFQNSGTSNVVITMDIFKQAGAQPLYINRAFTYDDNARGRPASWLTVQEVVQ